ncbi:MAG TPA: zinc-binding dehydrogenase, partial [Armatimonadota bacterium]|nr:zinc-binding dehydrogenase [Armatimonadota bacterium]
MKTWNIVFTGPATAELRHEPVPELGPTQVLIRARKTLISMGTELICYQRNFAPGTHWDRWVRYPFHPGYSMAGVVEAVGAEVEGFRPGDRVVSREGHRQLVVVESTRPLKIPDEVSDEEGTWFGIACIVQNAVRRAEHELGDAVVVVGLGPLGQLAVQYARLGGAREVIGIDPVPQRLERAARWLTAALPVPVDQARDAVRDRTEGRGADVVYDVTGHPAVLPAALALPRRFGKLVLLGDAGTPSEQRLTSDLLTRGLRIIGTHYNNQP